MPAPPPSNQADHSTSILWIVVALFVFILAIWYTFKPELIKAYLTVKWYEIHWLQHLKVHRFDPLKELIASALPRPGAIPPQAVMDIGTIVGKFLRIPFFIILFGMALLVYFGNAARNFQRHYSLQSLAQLEQVNWPQIKPVVRLRLEKMDIDVGPWAMAMTPMQFCKKHKLLQEVQLQQREGVSRKEWNKIGVVLKRGEANKLFSLQLGALWQGVHKLQPYVQALFAAFAARIKGDSKVAEKLFVQLATSSAGRLNVGGVKALCDKYAQFKLVEDITNSHAYVYTVMASMLARARDDGVQASADFLWLKAHDRRLWYVLNTVGRQTPFVEVAGVFAHWIAEKEAGSKLLVPFVEEATNALELSLKEIVYHADKD